MDHPRELSVDTIERAVLENNEVHDLVADECEQCAPQQATFHASAPQIQQRVALQVGVQPKSLMLIAWRSMSLWPSPTDYVLTE